LAYIVKSSFHMMGLCPV